MNLGASIEMEVLVIGFGGVSYHLLSTMREKMPHLNRLMENGSRTTHRLQMFVSEIHQDFFEARSKKPKVESSISSTTK